MAAEVRKELEVAFENVLLVGERFSRGVDIPEKMNFDFQFKMKEQVLPGDKGQLDIIALVTGVAEEKAVFQLECHFAGMFILKSEDEQLKKDFLMKKAPEMVFPYLREHITAITQKAGLKTLIVPLIDIVALAKQQGNQQPKQ